MRAAPVDVIVSAIHGSALFAMAPQLSTCPLPWSRNGMSGTLLWYNAGYCGLTPLSRKYLEGEVTVVTKDLSVYDRNA